MALRPPIRVPAPQCDATPLGDIDIENIFTWSDDASPEKVWGCDIRSMRGLLKSSRESIIPPLNPYTRQPLPEAVVKICNATCDPEVLEVFQHLNRSGYFLDFRMVYGMSQADLCELYLALEDTWSYRLEWSDEYRGLFVPKSEFGGQPSGLFQDKTK
eukprot:gene2585-3295_t